MFYEIGDPIPLGIQTYDDSDPPQPANAGAVTLTVRFPDATSVTYTSASGANPVTNNGAGAYRLDPDLIASQVGRHVYQWQATGVNAATIPPDIFDVRPVMVAPLLSLGSARSHLNKTFTTIADETELRDTIFSITAPVEDVIGPVHVRATTEDYPTGVLLVLRTWPVISLTSLVPVHTDGESYDPDDCDLDTDLAIVRRKDRGGFLGPLRVTYQVGRRVVDPSITEAGKVILRHLWDLQRGRSAARRGLGEDPEDLVPTPSGFLIPRRAMQLLNPHRRPPNLS